MNCRFNWCTNMKAQVELYAPENHDTIFRTYDLKDEDANNLYQMVKELYNSSVLDWGVISITFYNIAQLPNSAITFKDFTIYGWDAKTIILYVNGKEMILHEPLRK